MQSIALVLSQTDFCAALGHLGQPSLASPVPAWNRFKSAILCHLKEKELQSSGFCLLFFAKPLTLEKIPILPEVRPARPSWTVSAEVLASVLHVFNVFSPQGPRCRILFVFKYKKINNNVIKPGNKKHYFLYQSVYYPVWTGRTVSTRRKSLITPLFPQRRHLMDSLGE